MGLVQPCDCLASAGLKFGRPGAPSRTGTLGSVPRSASVSPYSEGPSRPPRPTPRPILALFLGFLALDFLAVLVFVAVPVVLGHSHTDVSAPSSRRRLSPRRPLGGTCRSAIVLISLSKSSLHPPSPGPPKIASLNLCMSRRSSFPRWHFSPSAHLTWRSCFSVISSWMAVRAYACVQASFSRQ